MDWSSIEANLKIVRGSEVYRNGYTGAGYRIGVLDTGVRSNDPSLAGRVDASLTYTDATANDLSVADWSGHGTLVAQIAGGIAPAPGSGGAAPGSSIVSGRIVADSTPWDGGLVTGGELLGSIGVKQILEDMASRDVRIVNASWGGLRRNGDNETTLIGNEYWPFIYEHGGLVVFAAGDEPLRGPNELAALPSVLSATGMPLAGHLERGWLTVAAVDPTYYHTLADYSSACGVAMDYCLVAPGTVRYTATDASGNPVLGQLGSTAFAAPLVSGAAALVWEAFPYFDNKLLRQTLLTTAWDIGEPGVDPVFGHGLLDVNRALLGPARFDGGNVEVNLAGSRGTMWQNPISGDAEFILRSDGQWSSLVLSGKNTFTGRTFVGARTNLIIQNDYASNIEIDREGSVQITTGVISGDTTIHSGGALHLDNSSYEYGWDGPLRVSGDIVNKGYVSVRATSGMTFGGNYVQEAGSLLRITLGADPLHFTGSAQLGGTLNIAGIAPGYVARLNTDILIADGGVTGQFGGMTWDSSLLLDAHFMYGPDRVWLDVTRAHVVTAASALGGITSAALGSAVRVEDAFGRIDAGISGGIPAGVPASAEFAMAAGQLQRSASPDALISSLRSLSGEVHASAAAATYDTLDLGRRALSSRFDDLSSGSRPAGGWMEALGGAASLGGGVDAQVDGWLAGHDVGLDGALVAGLAFGESTIDSRIDGLADRSRERQTQAQAYMGQHWNQGYVMGQFGAGQWQRQIDRELLLGAGRYGVHSEYDGGFAVAGLEAGYRFDGAAGSLVPYLGTEHAQVRSDGFHEQGAAGFGLRTGASISSRTQAIAGLRASREGQRVSLSGHVEWQETLASDGLVMSASFVGVDSWSPLAGSEPALSGGMFGLAAKAWLSPSSTLALGYDQRFGPRGDASLVSVKYAFGF